MSIYWIRCKYCGRHYPVRSCWLHPEDEVCAYCCLACPERGECPKPTWFPEIKPQRREARRAAVRRKQPVSTKEEVLEELLKKLSGEG